MYMIGLFLTNYDGLHCSLLFVHVIMLIVIYGCSWSVDSRKENGVYVHVNRCARTNVNFTKNFISKRCCIIKAVLDVTKRYTRSTYK